MNMTKIAGALLVGMLAVGGCGRASGPVDVGGTPDLSFDAVGGEKVSLAALKGKIVIVDFWATWCGPCMGEAPHMAAINRKYSDKGLQIIGISLDEDVNRMTQVARQQGFTWPQYCDGKAWQSPLAVAWGVNSIPHTFLIGPEGKILWTGHPAMLDDALADAFANHPPQRVDPQY